MTNLIPNYLRQIEIAALVLENPDKFSEDDLAYRYNISVATFRRDAGALRKIGVGIYSRKRRYRIDNIALDVLNDLIFDYLSLSQKSKIKNLRLFRNKFKEKTLSTFVTIASCIKNKNEIEFYYGNRESEYYSKRIVFPVELRRTLRTFHLLALDCGEVKAFNLEKIYDVKNTGRKAKLTVPPDATGKYLHVWGDSTAGELVVVKLRFGNDMKDYVMERFWLDGQQVEADGKGVVLTLKVKLSYDFIAWVIGWGNEVEILEPEELKEDVVSKAKDILGLYKHRR